MDCIRNNTPIQRDGIDVAVLMTEMSDAVEEAAKMPVLPARPLILDAEIRGIPELEIARRIAASGRMGELLNIRVHCCGAEPLEILTEQARKILSTFFGRPLGEKSIVSSAGPKEGHSAVVLLLFENKRLGIAEACSGTPEYERSVDICGTHGGLRIRGDQVSYTDTKPGNRNAVWLRRGSITTKKEVCDERSEMRARDRSQQQCGPGNCYILGKKRLRFGNFLF